MRNHWYRGGWWTMKRPYHPFALGLVFLTWILLVITTLAILVRSCSYQEPSIPHRTRPADSSTRAPLA